MPQLRISLLLTLPLLAVACRSTQVEWFASAEEATAAIVTAAAEGDDEEATRIFNTFAASSVQRDRVYAELFDAAETRYSSGKAGEAANILDFVTQQYPGATAAREALVYSLFIDRADRGAATEDSARALEAAIADVRAATPSPAAWVDLAGAQAAIDRGDLVGARQEFQDFKSVWDGGPAVIIPYVEDIERYLASH